MAKRQAKQTRTDAERLDWLSKQDGSGLISDDFGHWAVSSSGMQNVPKKTPADISTTFFVEEREWQKTVRAAIDCAMDDEARGV